jgi:DNA-binding HxlR family transcriptional regulator
MKPTNAHDTNTCHTISNLLSRVGDKWTILVVRNLGGGTMRFNAIQRQIGDISQKMLATTLRNLERDGFVTRKVTPSAPPQVEYALTDLGVEFLTPVCTMASWAIANSPRIELARQTYDNRNGFVQAAE